MEFDLATLGVVIGMMVLANRLVEMLVTPLFDKYNWDKFWLMYPAWILSGVQLFGQPGFKYQDVWYVPAAVYEEKRDTDSPCLYPADFIEWLSKFRAILGILS